MFLKVSQWYELVVFTASMEIYGAAVADRLDAGRGILQRRFYRQHCTPDLGSYTKDLSAICNDLSSVFILDNSPGAYRAYPGKDNHLRVVSSPSRINDFCFRQRDPDKVVVQRPDRRGTAEPAARPGRAALHGGRAQRPVAEPPPAQALVARPVSSPVDQISIDARFSRGFAVARAPSRRPRRSRCNATRRRPIWARSTVSSRRSRNSSSATTNRGRAKNSSRAYRNACATDLTTNNNRLNNNFMCTYNNEV